MAHINIRQSIMLFFFLGISQVTFCDNIQETLNLNYFRTPEASAFMKYGEESVNEYTGTADISVPLYTIKCKDIEIPLVLRYDATGIKVEQEASWVGLGWNLMVGGCINYVCAGSHDQYTQSYISNQIWTEYLTTMNTFTGGRQYFHYSSDNINTWMESVPHAFAFDPPHSENLSQDMQNYLMWGYGERDFYSVNVLGKSFNFFIDPATLKPYIIGEAGEEFKIDPIYRIDPRTGIGNQTDVNEWKITDSNGYIYYFSNGDTTWEGDNQGMSYIFCWYLTGIQSPLGEKAELSYTQHQEWGRQRMTESFSHIHSNVSVEDKSFGSEGHSKTLHSGRVKNSYLKEIKTRNQTVTFSTTESRECSGRKLDVIRVNSYDGAEIKTINFSYSSFGHSNIGGSYAPVQNATADLRLKLENVKETASSETLTTSFSYNPLELPAKKSCAQDYWGYYNGKDNPATSDAKGNNGHTMLPTPATFMSKNYDQELAIIKGANRSSDGNFMQAAMLTKVVYPTGGYSTYEYEPHRFAVTDYRQSKEYQDFLNRPYDIDIYKSFSYTPYNSEDSFLIYNEPYDFTLKKELAFSLSVSCNGDVMDGKKIQIIIAPLRAGITPISIPVTYKSSNNPVIVLQDTLPAGNYQLLIGAPGSVHQGYAIGCRLKGYYTSTSSFNHDPQKTYTQTGGGLRIRKISNYDNDNSLINYVTYDYTNGKGSTGVLLNEIETIEPFSYTYLRYEPNGSGPATAYSRHNISGRRINTGQTRFPAFFESCNPGNVGYSQVTKCKYDAIGNLEKSIVTSYINHKPKTLTVMDYYECFDNGKMLCQETLEADGNTISKTENEYCFHDLNEDDPEKDKWYSTNMVARDGLVIDPRIAYLDNDAYNSRFQVWKYPYILSRVDLSKTTNTEYCPGGNTIVKTKDYLYNTTNHQVSRIDENTSLSNQILRTRITYSADGTDAYSRWMKDAHRLNDVVETKTALVENGQEHCISTQRTNYTSRYVNGASHYLPGSSSTSIGDNAPETRATYSYDDSLNVCAIALDGMETVYIWSYNGQYPIAKIEGLTYAEVKAAVGQSTISNLLCKAEPSDGDFNSIRNAVKNARGHITTYTYRPLVGITSETLPNGNTTYYEYDGFGRLTSVTDHNGSVISTNSYNYKAQ